MRLRYAAVLAATLLLTACSSYVSLEGGPSGPAPDCDEPRGRAKAARLGIPPGHLPPPGECRIWIPGRPTGHQPPPGRCSALEREVPRGAWLLYRPDRDRKHVEVSVFDERRPRVVMVVRVYRAESGEFVREMSR